MYKECVKCEVFGACNIEDICNDCIAEEAAYEEEQEDKEKENSHQGGST